MPQELSRHWRLNDERYQLVGTGCGECGTRFFPPRISCSCCGRETVAVQMPRTGTVYSYAGVVEPPAGYAGRTCSYPMALIDLDRGPRLTAQLTDVDPDDVRIGMRVEMVTRRIKEDGDRGLISYGYKFRPILDREQQLD